MTSSPTPNSARGRGGAFHRGARSNPYVRNIMDGISSTPRQGLVRPADVVEGDRIEIKDLKYVGSYNWVNTARDRPTIVVPGSPAEWCERVMPYTVKPDSGIDVVDQDAFRIPKQRLLPLFRAADIVAEENGESIDWAKVDFVTTRNALRKLLRWVKGNNSVKEFRIDTQFVGARTVLFSSWQERDTRKSCGGYGFNFERAATRPAPGCENTVIAGHNRIVKYVFDGLVMVVIFEVDAYLPVPELSNEAAKSETATLPDSDGLEDRLAGLNMESDSDKTKSPPDQVLKIIRAGRQIPQDSIVELTAKKKMVWSEDYPQLYLSGTPHHFFALHDGDEFTGIRKRHMSDDEMLWHDTTFQPGFRGLRRALKEIHDVIASSGEQGRLSLVYQNRELRVYDRTDKTSALPESVMERFRS